MEKPQAESHVQDCTCGHRYYAHMERRFGATIGKCLADACNCADYRRASAPMSEPKGEGEKARCTACGDAGRLSLAQEIREGLKVRGLWAPDRPSDLVTAVFKALEATK
jgi:hypothetical protein